MRSGSGFPANPPNRPHPIAAPSWQLLKWRIPESTVYFPDWQKLPAREQPRIATFPESGLDMNVIITLLTTPPHHPPTCTAPHPPGLCSCLKGGHFNRLS